MLATVPPPGGRFCLGFSPGVLRMNTVSRVLVTIGLALVAFSNGCGRVVYRPNQQPVSAAQQQMQMVAQQNQEYQTRAHSLDNDNQELETLLAQSRQQVQLLTDEVTATREQLRTTTEQLLAVRNDNQQLKSKTSALVASTRQRAGAEIRANNSLLKNLSLGDIPGVKVRQDGDVVRVEISGDQIFMPGSNYLKSGADQLLQSVAAELRRSFPNQIIGIEGHTDDSPTHSQKFPSNHHLSAAQALAVYNVLIQKGVVPAQQLFVIGHAANHPVVSNATESGKARNRRTELVVYPERMASR